MLSVKNLSEKSLAGYQQTQIGNSCAVSSACAALNLLFDSHIQSQDWIKKVDNLSFPAILKMRLYRNGPTMPFQQMNLLRWIAETNHFTAISIKRETGTRNKLLDILTTNRQVALVTVGWFFTTPPEITIGDTANNYNATQAKFGWHTMLVAAYNPAHICTDGLVRPWGFINSWGTGGEDLFWMSEAVFLRSWSIYTPPIGTHSMVIVQIMDD